GAAYTSQAEAHGRQDEERQGGVEQCGAAARVRSRRGEDVKTDGDEGRRHEQRLEDFACGSAPSAFALQSSETQNERHERDRRERVGHSTSDGGEPYVLGQSE